MRGLKTEEKKKEVVEKLLRCELFMVAVQETWRHGDVQERAAVRRIASWRWGDGG